MRVKLSRHGNSLGIVVPASVVREEGLEAGQEYELEVTASGELHLAPVSRPVWRPDMSIEELLAGLPEEPLKYEDVPDYRPVGRELDW